jgi:hypothetical protein
MKVKNMESSRSGRAVANQFIITDEGRGALGNFTSRQVFQSYDSIIARVTRWPDCVKTELDETYWNYSRTTTKYLCQFLGMNTKQIKEKIESGAFKLADLNFC